MLTDAAAAATANAAEQQTFRRLSNELAATKTALAITRADNHEYRVTIERATEALQAQRDATAAELRRAREAETVARELLDTEIRCRREDTESAIRRTEYARACILAGREESAQLRAANAGIMDRMNSVTRERDALAADLHDATDKCKRAKTELDRVSGALEGTKGQLLRAREDAEYLGEQLEAAMADNCMLRGQLSEAVIECATARDELRAAVDACADTAAELQEARVGGTRRSSRRLAGAPPLPARDSTVAVSDPSRPPVRPSTPPTRHTTATARRMQKMLETAVRY